MRLYDVCGKSRTLALPRMVASKPSRSATPYICVILKRFCCAKDLPRYFGLNCCWYGSLATNRRFAVSSGPHSLRLLLSSTVRHREILVPTMHSDPPIVDSPIRSARSFLLAKALELSLASYGPAHIAVALVVHKPVTLIFLSESVVRTGLMLPDTMHQVAAHSGVKHARIAGHNVNGINVLAHWAKHYKA